MTDVFPTGAVSVALAVLVLASGCIAPAADTPESSTKTVATTTTAPTSSTTTAPATTTAPTIPNSWDELSAREVDNRTYDGAYFSIQTGLIEEANESVEEFYGVKFPAKYVMVGVSEGSTKNATYALATNCTEYRGTVNPEPVNLEVAFNRTYNVTEWEFVKIANADTGEVMLSLDLGEPSECEPPIPEPNASVTLD